MHDVQVDERLGLRRGDVVVCIPVYGGYELFTQCFGSVLRHTDPEVPILVCDDASVEPRFPEFVRNTLETGDWPHDVRYLRQPSNGGFVANVNAAFAVAAPADVIILNSDTIVSDGWVQGLYAAAYSDSKVATATALTNAGTIVSVPHRNHSVGSLPADATVDGVAAAIRRASAKLYPDLPACVGHCVYVRRQALDLVGQFDLWFSPGYEEEVDFSQRCAIHGMRHVLADDVFIFHRHRGSFGSAEDVEELRRKHHEVIASRYPYFDAWVAEVSGDPSSRLATSLAVASGAIRGTSVTIDGRCLNPVMTGTALATLELVAALDTYTDFTLRLVVPDDLGSYAAAVLGQRSKVQTLSTAALEGHVEPTDLAHRPYQVGSPNDTLLLKRLGHRMVLTQLDSIAYRNPSYFDDYRQWRAYRTTVAASLAAADQVVFISRAGANDARSLDLVAEEQVNVIPLATEQALSQLYPDPVIPGAVDQIGGRPFLLCLGTDFLHKNRLFAIKLLEALREQERFDGMLVFAGPKVSQGSSGGEEAEYLAARPSLAGRVLDFAAVAEAEKLWLLSQAAAVVYPTTYEGFGLVPFEAARVGTACLFAWHSSLADYLPQSAALIAPWDPAATATRAAPVLVPGAERDRLVSAVRMAGARLTASTNARRHAEAYARALSRPAAQAARLAQELLELEIERRKLEREFDEIYNDPLNRGLAGRYAVLPEDMRRPVLAVATRPALRGTVTSLYRAARFARHRFRGSDQRKGGR